MSTEFPGSTLRDAKSWSIWQGMDVVAALPEYFHLDNRESSDILATNNSENAPGALTICQSAQIQCRVPGCLISNCSLSTHKKFDPESTRRNRPRERRASKTLEVLQQLQLYDQEKPSSEGIDGFPILPIQESQDMTTRSLFHYFFTNAFDKLALLFRGPSVNNMSLFKERMLATAMGSEAYCRGLILQARTEQDRNVKFPLESKEALHLYNNALTAFREQLATIRQRPHPLQIELALLVICTLIMFDEVHGRVEAMKIHWQGLRDLVWMRGGMHCVTMALAYTIHTDRACAIRFDEIPTFTNTLAQPLPMPIPFPGSSRYGTKFHAMRQGPITIDPAVLDYLMDVSGLVELWEQSRTQNIIPHFRGQAASSEYLHYVRDRLDDQFALLNAHWAQVDSPERCLLWTSRLVEYPVTWSNYVPTMTSLQCHKLAVTLRRHNNPFEPWRSNLDMLVWILFAMATVEPGSEANWWTLGCLRDLLDAKYGNAPWPPTWWADEQENLVGFVWSSSHHTSSFQVVCGELANRPSSMDDAGHRHIKPEK